MSYYEIRGGKPLKGSVTISGSKNAALPIICACILSTEPCRIENLPDIEDVRKIIEIIGDLGAKITKVAKGVFIIDPRSIDKHVVTIQMAKKLRASYYALGAMLGKYGEAQIAQPGGCAIGQRPMDYHINGMRALGADVKERGGIITAKASKLVGAEIFFDIASVGATINIMLASCLAHGVTVINNAAREPHVVDVANFLNSMGASIRGAGTDIIRIKGTKRLHGSTYAVIPDQIEAGTYMIAAAATKGDVIINNVIPAHLEAISAKLMESGAEVIEGDNGSDFFIEVKTKENPRPVNIRTQPYPGFPTDLQQPMTSLLALADGGHSSVTENLFEKRFNHVPELNRMGADITVFGRTASINGVPKLYGAEVTATDLRAGAAMVIAALAAEGTSRINNIAYIDRGYERIEEKLRALGADIKKIEC